MSLYMSVSYGDFRSDVRPLLFDRVRGNNLRAMLELLDPERFSIVLQTVFKDGDIL